MAPYRGGGESQTRYRFRVPPAHVVEHGVHSLHWPQPPRSESVFIYEKKSYCNHSMVEFIIHPLKYISPESEHKQSLLKSRQTEN